MGFAVWLMWSVTNAKIQQTHDKDPSVYYFKDFAGTYKGVSEGYRGCPGWYEESCCKTWKDIKDDDWKLWAKGVKDMSDADREAMGVPGGMDAFDSANDMMYSKAFSDMNLSPNATIAVNVDDIQKEPLVLSLVEAHPQPTRWIHEVVAMPHVKLR